MKLNINAASTAQLVEILANVDRAEPPFDQKLPNWFVENRSISTFLCSFAEVGFICFPIELVGSRDNRDCESPDFELVMNGVHIGIEHTRAGDPSMFWGFTLTKENPGTVIELSQFSPVAAGGTKTPVRPYLVHDNMPLRGRGFQGNERVNTWVEYQIAAVLKKTQVLAGANFKRFEKDWLLITDYTMIFAGLDVHDALARLARRLEDQGYWQKPERFSDVFIEVQSHMIYLSEGSQRISPKVAPFENPQVSD